MAVNAQLMERGLGPKLIRFPALRVDRVSAGTMTGRTFQQLRRSSSLTLGVMTSAARCSGFCFEPRIRIGVNGCFVLRVIKSYETSRSSTVEINNKMILGLLAVIIRLRKQDARRRKHRRI